MRYLICALILFLVMINLLWSGNNRSYDDYFEQLHEKAVKNLSSLPENIRDNYMSLLDEYPDVFMAFFLAYEEGSKLLLADLDDILSHHGRVKDLWRITENEYSLPFFLSYVAKITVTEERITPYRDLFEEKGLYELKGKYDDPAELIREINLWTRKFMTFKPTSGRDMAPFDIIKRSNIGRCEEMQIFFISAARSLGVPARPAMTPLWAHTDNNHAWVEVFVDGGWYYLGAVEPAYFLNEAWFSASAARAIMIMATAAFPDESDIVLSNRGYSALINSTPNYDSEYFSSRYIEIVTLDEEGNSLPETGISVMVFNWGMLRSIHSTATDSTGVLDLVTGSGSFFIAAAKDSLFALYEIPAQEEDYRAEITLYHEKVPSINTALRFPDPQLPRFEAPAGWDEYRRTFEDAYRDIVAVYQERDFPYENSSDVMLSIWDKCRNNKDNFLTFYDKNRPLEERFISLADKIDEKFLWQADPNQWQNLYDSYQEMKHLQYSDNILALLISPTTMFEEIPNNRLDRGLLAWRDGDKDDRIGAILEHLEKNYEIDEERAVIALLPYDQLMRLPYLTPYQYKMLSCSVLRENHIPAAYTRIPDVINIYINDEWLYYNLKERSFITAETDTEEKPLTELIIRTIDEDDYPLQVPGGQYTLTFLQEKFFYPYERQPERDAEGNLTVNLEPGTYQIQIGYRINDNLTRFAMEPLIVDGESDLEKRIVLYDYPGKWDTITDEIASLLEELDLLEFQDQESFYLILGDHDREPVRRTADRLATRVSGARILWLGARYLPEAPEHYEVSQNYERWLLDNPIMARRVITLYYNSDIDVWSFYDGFWDILPEE